MIKIIYIITLFFNSLQEDRSMVVSTEEIKKCVVDIDMCKVHTTVHVCMHACASFIHTPYYATSMYYITLYRN